MAAIPSATPNQLPQPFDDNILVPESFSDITAAFPSPGLPPLSDWDTVIIAGTAFHGEVNGRVGTKLDKKSAMGKNGSGYGQNGQRAEPIKIKVYLYTYDELNAISQVVNRCMNFSDQPTPVAVTVQYPGLSLFNVQSGSLTQLYLHTATIPTPPRGGEPGTCTLDFEQFLLNSGNNNAAGADVDFAAFANLGTASDAVGDPQSATGGVGSPGA